MGASSVTGTGPGASNGEYKPEHHCGGCGCGSQDEEEPTPPRKTSCRVVYRTGGTARYVASGGATGIKVC